MAGPRQDKVSLWRAAQSRLCPARLRPPPRGSAAARPVPWRGGGGSSIPEAAGPSASPGPRAAGPAMFPWERRRARPGAARGSPWRGRSRSVQSPTPRALFLRLGSPRHRAPGTEGRVTPRAGVLAARGAELSGQDPLGASVCAAFPTARAGRHDAAVGTPCFLQFNGSGEAGGPPKRCPLPAAPEGDISFCTVNSGWAQGAGQCFNRK